MLLTYDDIPLSGGPALVSAPGFIEQGFQFSLNMVAIDLSTVSGAGTGFAALNDYNGPITITEANGSAFSFTNTMMKGWNTQTTGGTITGYMNGQPIGSMDFAVLGPDAGGGRPIAYWSMISPDFSYVTSIVINGTAPLLLTSTQVGPAVSEPATAVLLAIGLLAAMWFNRRVVWP